MRTPRGTGGEPLFLARETYRRRRLMDAARILPYLGVFAFLFPTLWASGTGTASGLVYIFAVWLILIGLALIVSRRLPVDAPPEAGPEEQEGD